MIPLHHVPLGNKGLHELGPGLVCARHTLSWTTAVWARRRVRTETQGDGEREREESKGRYIVRERDREMERCRDGEIEIERGSD